MLRNALRFRHKIERFIYSFSFLLCYEQKNRLGGEKNGKHYEKDGK